MNETMARPGHHILTLLSTDLSWQDKANCRGCDVEAFYFADGERGMHYKAKAEAALRVCANCPVKLECLKDAVDRDDRHSIQGGTTPKDRGVLVTGQKNLPLEQILKSLKLKEKYAC